MPSVYSFKYMYETFGQNADPVNPLYTGRLFHCYMLDESIAHFRGVRTILSLLFYFWWKNPVSKQCRPWSDATLCGIWSGSALFFYDSFMGFPERMG